MSNTHRKSLLPFSDSVNGERIFALNEDIDAADNTVTLWPLKQMKTIHGTVERLYLSSSDDTDVSVIGFNYIDVDGKEQSAVATLSGYDFVDTGIDALFVNQSEVINGQPALVGNAYLSRTNTGTDGIPTDNTKIESYIINGDSISQVGMFYITEEYQRAAFLGGHIIVASAAALVNGVKVKLRYQVGAIGPAKTFENMVLATGWYEAYEPPFVIPITPGTYLWVEVNTISTNNVHLSGTFYIEKGSKTEI